MHAPPENNDSAPPDMASAHTSSDEVLFADSTTEATSMPRNDIVEFIQQESLQNKTQSDQLILETYSSTLWKGFFMMKHKLIDVAELDCDHAVDMGLQLVDNLFWIIYHYSSNVQLTLFLTERGRLLYTEFLHMSRTHQLMKELHTYPSINDGFQFAIKKSIGALKCQTHTTNMGFDHISAYRNMYRKMFQMMNRKYLQEATSVQWTDDQIHEVLQQLNRSMSVSVQSHLECFECCLYEPAVRDFSLREFLLVLCLISAPSTLELFGAQTDVPTKVLSPSDTLECTTTIAESTPVSTASVTNEQASNVLLTSSAFVEHVVRFVQENRVCIDPCTLECLGEHSVLQHKWKLYQHKIVSDIRINGEHTSHDSTSSLMAWPSTDDENGGAHTLADSLESLGSVSDT